MASRASLSGCLQHRTGNYTCHCQRSLLWRLLDDPRTIYVGVSSIVKLVSLLSLSWISVVLPPTFAEVIALELRRQGSGHNHIYPQIFEGLAYFVASGCIYELRRFNWNQKYESWHQNNHTDD